MECQICLSSFERVRPVDLTCGCRQCSYCLTSWIISEVQELSYQTHKHIICMNDECKRKFDISDIIDQLSIHQQNMIHEALFQAYLKDADDIRKCPKKDCNYAGIINIVTPCSDNLECAKCDMKWVDKSQLNYEATSYASLLDKSSYHAFWNSIWEIFFTKQCPQCGVSIQKDGGCSHMTCRKCANSFCWVCLQNLGCHNSKRCLVGKSVRLFLTLFLLIHLVLSFNLLNLICWGLSKSLQLFTVQLCATSGLFSFKLSKFLSAQNDWKAFGGCFVIFWSCILVIYSFEFITTAFYILLFEGVILFTIAIYDHGHSGLSFESLKFYF